MKTSAILFAAALAALASQGCASVGEVGAGQCPNACDSGWGVQKEVCSAAADCLCGLDCVDGACKAYDGPNELCGCLDGTTAPAPIKVAVLGDGSHDPATVIIDEIGSSADGLDRPRDLAMHPSEVLELWVVNELDHSMVIFTNTGEAGQKSVKKATPSGAHFMAKPAALAFGTTTLATAHDEDQITQDTTPVTFMGPTMWPADKDKFDGGGGSHPESRSTMVSCS